MIKTLIAIVLLTICTPVFAGDIVTDVQVRKIISANDNLESTIGTKASIGYSPEKGVTWFGWVSKDSRMLREAGQRSPWKADLTGYGIGGEMAISKYFSIRADVGYYDSQGNGDTVRWEEGQVVYWQKFLNEARPSYGCLGVKDFSGYKKTVKSDFGGELTATASYPFKVGSVDVTPSLNVGYRYLRMGVYRQARLGGGWFETKSNEDFGGPVVGVGIGIRF